MIIGDPAYPLLHSWLLRGYSGSNLTPLEDSFNVHLNSGRVAVEIAFGRLKARWRCLLKRIDVHYSFVPEVVAACCTLHNIVESYKEIVPTNWIQAVQDAEFVLLQPVELGNRWSDDYGDYDLRIFLTDYLSKNFPLRQSTLRQ